MIKEMIKILLLFVMLAYVMDHVAHAQLSSETVKSIDTIRNNTAVDITLEPVSSVKINSFTGGFALQSGGLKELEESAVTSTELGFVSGVTSSIQTQIDGKQDALPLSVNGDILFYNGGFQSLPIGTANQVLTVTGGLPVWADPQGSSPTTTLGDLIYNDGGGAGSDVRLPIGTNDQILTVVAGEPSWADNAAASFWECQEKFLTADVTTNVTSIADLTFNNLTIGKIYETCIYLDGFGGAVGNDNFTLAATHNGGNVNIATVSVPSSTAIVKRHSTCRFFTATATTMTHDSSSITSGNTIRGNGTIGRTYTRLCELPDNYIINSTKFN